MRIVGILLALVGWLIPLVGLTVTQSLTARFVLVVLGIGISLTGILGQVPRSVVSDRVNGAVRLSRLSQRTRVSGVTAGGINSVGE